MIHARHDMFDRPQHIALKFGIIPVPLGVSEKQG